jgi:hypothetical protein
MSGDVSESAALSHRRFVGVDWAGRDLTGVRLTCVDLTGADLRGARLTGASLRFVVAPGARLSGIEAEDVFLDHVDLSRGRPDLRAADQGNVHQHVTYPGAVGRSSARGSTVRAVLDVGLQSPGGDLGRCGHRRFRCGWGRSHRCAIIQHVP